MTASGDDPLAGLTQIHVVQNWFEELKTRVPVPSAAVGRRCS